MGSSHEKSARPTSGKNVTKRVTTGMAPYMTMRCTNWPFRLRWPGGVPQSRAEDGVLLHPHEQRQAEQARDAQKRPVETEPEGTPLEKVGEVGEQDEHESGHAERHPPRQPDDDLSDRSRRPAAPAGSLLPGDDEARTPALLLASPKTQDHTGRAAISCAWPGREAGSSSRPRARATTPAVAGCRRRGRHPRGACASPPASRCRRRESGAP